MKTVQQINKEWGGEFIKTLNAGDAAIVFALGERRDNIILMCITEDITMSRLKKVLQKLIDGPLKDY